MQENFQWLCTRQKYLASYLVEPSVHAPRKQVLADCSPASAASTTNSEIPRFSVLVAAITINPFRADYNIK